MKSNRDGDFEKQMHQLIELLKKVMTQHPNARQWSKLESLFKDQGINLNIAFFNFFPIMDEELDALEEIYDQYFSAEDEQEPELSGELNAADIDFLRRHGIRF